MDAQKRIAELEAVVADQSVQIADQSVQIAARDARITELERQVAELLERVSVLAELLGQNSNNSHKPPSSDPPGTGDGSIKKKDQRRSKAGKKRKRGGQPGHKGNHRGLLSESEVDEFVDYYPHQCENCWQSLGDILDVQATRFQVTELPAGGGRHVTEYRAHTVRCACGHRTRGRFGAEVPKSPFGPRLMSIVALLTGVYHLSRRRTVSLLHDLFHVRMSLGAVSSVEGRVSDAVAPAVDETWTKLDDVRVKHTDGTGWLQAGAALSVWTIATTMVTVFKIVTDSSKKTLESLLGNLAGLLVSDRAAALNFWAMERRQVCWAHLLRKFVSFSERDGPAGRFGRELLEYTGLVFEYWHAYKDGAISKATFRAWMIPVRAGIEATLDRASSAEIKRLSGSCANLREHRLALWTFVDTDGVEPTNNHAERELRAFVLWRKRSFGSQSDRGNRFAERVMTICHTARKQGRDVLSFLTACCEASAEGMATPSMFADCA